MNKSTEFIYKVSFRESPKNDGRKDFYFTSLAAIYEQFTSEEIGCNVENLWRVGVRVGNPYYGKLCSVTRETIVRKAQRGSSRTQNGDSV